MKNTDYQQALKEKQKIGNAKIVVGYANYVLLMNAHRPLLNTSLIFCKGIETGRGAAPLLFS